LVRRRVELQSDVDAAHNRAAAVAPRRAALNAEIARIGRELFLRKINEAVEEGVRLNGEAHAIVEQICEPLARVAALRSALLTIAGTKGNAGEKGAEHAILVGAERLDNLPLPNVTFNGQTLNRYTAEWMGRLR
jgi:hypothetical protein